MTARYDCEICGGAGVVRLPRAYQRALVSNFNPRVPISATMGGYKEYPCPECGDNVPIDRLATVQFHAFVADHIRGDPDYDRHAREHAAHGLVSNLLDHKFISFERGPPDSRERKYKLVATVGVAAPGRVASLEERIAARQIEIAQEVVEQAVSNVGVWGSYFRDNHVIRKDDAYRMIREAIPAVLAKRVMTKVET